MIVEILLFVSAVLLLRLWITSRTPKNFPPGPRGIPVVGFIPFMGAEPHWTFTNLAKKHGDIIGTKLGVYNAVVLNSIELMKNVFKKDIFNGRPEFFLYNIVEVRKQGVIRSEGRYWTEQRRYTLHHLRDFGFGKRTMEDLILEEVHEVLDVLRKNNGKSIDLDEPINCAVVNTLWQMATGERLRLEDEKLHFFTATISKFLSEPLYLISLGFLPALQNLFPKWSGANELIKFEEDLNSILREIIKKHQQKESFSSNDFTDEYLSKISGTEDKESSFYGDKGMHSLLIVLQDFFIAGTETTASFFKWIFLHLIIFPELQRKCQEEIDRVIGRERTPKLEDKARLPYCDAFLTEVMRYRPVLPFAVVHQTTEDVELMNYSIPKGTLLLPNIWNVHNDPKLWDNPEEFNPDRFIDQNGKCSINTENVIPFGIGKRSCLGEVMARTELFLFTTTLLQHFTLSVPKDDPMPTLNPDTSSLLLKPCSYEVLITDRYAK